MFNGKIHYKWAISNRYVKLPEAIISYRHQGCHRVSSCGGSSSPQTFERCRVVAGQMKAMGARTGVNGTVNDHK